MLSTACPNLSLPLCSLACECLHYLLACFQHPDLSIPLHFLGGKFPLLSLSILTCPPLHSLGSEWPLTGLLSLDVLGLTCSPLCTFQFVSIACFLSLFLHFDLSFQFVSPPLLAYFLSESWHVPFFMLIREWDILVSSFFCHVNLSLPWHSSVCESSLAYLLSTSWLVPPFALTSKWDVLILSLSFIMLICLSLYTL